MRRPFEPPIGPTPDDNASCFLQAIASTAALPPRDPGRPSYPFLSEMRGADQSDRYVALQFAVIHPNSVPPMAFRIELSTHRPSEKLGGDGSQETPRE